MTGKRKVCTVYRCRRTAVALLPFPGGDTLDIDVCAQCAEAISESPAEWKITSPPGKDAKLVVARVGVEP